LRKLLLLEVLAYWHQKEPPDLGDWWPFIRLAGVILWLEFVAWLYLAGGLRPLSALG